METSPVMDALLRVLFVIMKRVNMPGGLGRRYTANLVRTEREQPYVVTVERPGPPGVFVFCLLNRRASYRESPILIS